jgi:hypothetical protein
MPRSATARRPPSARGAELTTLNVRGIDVAVVRRIKAAAAARGWTIGEYLVRAVEALDAMRALADSGRHEQVRTELRTFGLNTVET